MVDLKRTVAGAERLLRETAQRLTDSRTILDHMVSLADPDTHPIRKGKQQHPTRFGHTALIAEDERRFITFHQVSKGNPADAGQLMPTVEGVIEASAASQQLWSASEASVRRINDKDVADLDVQHIGLQRGGTLSKTCRQHEQTRSFRR